MPPSVYHDVWDGIGPRPVMVWYEWRVRPHIRTRSAVSKGAVREPGIIVTSERSRDVVVGPNVAGAVDGRRLLYVICGGAYFLGTRIRGTEGSTSEGTLGGGFRVGGGGGVRIAWRDDSAGEGLACGCCGGCCLIAVAAVGSGVRDREDGALGGGGGILTAAASSTAARYISRA